MPRRFLNPDPAAATPVPYEGVPGHLWEPVVNWFKNATSTTEQLRMIGLRLEVTWTPYGEQDVWGNTARLIGVATADGGDPEMMLELVHALLSVSAGYDAGTLYGILREGGSLYTVSDDGCGLERRLSDEIREAFGAAVSAVSGPTSAATHLRAAWAKLYGLRPDERAAYDQAVLALEAVVCPIAIPKDPKPTLGKAIGAMRQAPNGFWFSLGQNQEPTAVIDVLDTVWKTQVRHANATGPTDTTTPEEAQGAVHLAVAICHLFSVGAARRR